MPYKGVAKGKMIELEERLPYPEGQPLSVAVEPWGGTAVSGLPGGDPTGDARTAASQVGRGGRIGASHCRRQAASAPRRRV